MLRPYDSRSAGGSASMSNARWVAGEVSSSNALSWNSSQLSSVALGVQRPLGGQTVEQLLPLGEPLVAHALGWRKVLDAEAGLVRIAEHEVRIVSPAQPAAEKAGLRRPARAFLGHERHRDVGQHRRGGRKQLAHHRADRRIVGRPGPAPFLAPVVAGQGRVNGGGMRVVHAVMYRPQDGRVVDQPGHARQMLAELDARHGRGDRLKFTPQLDRRVGLHVPHVEVAGTAVEKNQDRRIRTGPAAALGRRLLGPQQARQTEPQVADRARLQHAAARDQIRGLHGAGILRRGGVVAGWRGETCAARAIGVRRNVRYRRANEFFSARRRRASGLAQLKRPVGSRPDSAAT